MVAINYRTVDVDGWKIFYREAGSKDAPTLLLLHGFPSAGHMFRDLIPHLADRFHIVAPDLPGFGQSDLMARGVFAYTFDHIAVIGGDGIATVPGRNFTGVQMLDIGHTAGFHRPWDESRKRRFSGLELPLTSYRTCGHPHRPGLARYSRDH